MARRLRQVIDLYTIGKVAVLDDGTPMWVQALNPFEQDTARNEAQIAKARLTMAIREHGSDEQAKVRMFFFDDGLDSARNKVVDARLAESMPTIIEKLRIDPDWSERLTVLERGLDDVAMPPEPGETELLETIARDYTTEVGKRLESEKSFLAQKFGGFAEDELWTEYLDWYLDRRSAEIMLAEYRVHQLLFGVRWCDGVRTEDGHWDHAACDGHQERAFTTKEEVRSVPEELVAILMDTADDVEVSVREAKNSRRQGSSSGSSPLPSEVGASTASTPSETRADLPGSSSSPSPTPSLSSATAS